MKSIRIVFVCILVFSAVVSIIIMWPFLLMYWWVAVKNERYAAEMVRAAVAKRAIG